MTDHPTPPPIPPLRMLTTTARARSPRRRAGEALPSLHGQRESRAAGALA